ncbi:hypothetical protein YC2023_026179 [Brassica napus]
MAKFTTFFFIIVLLLCSTLTNASAQPTPTSVYSGEISVEVSQPHHHSSYSIYSELINMWRYKQFKFVQKLEQGEENCEGVGEEECFLIRRTLAAHTDYIYTQNHNP